MKPTFTFLAVLAFGIVLFGIWKMNESGAQTDADPDRVTSPPPTADPLSPPPPEREEKRSLGARFLEGEFPPLTPKQIGVFVESQNRSAASLIAAWDIGGDASWLEAAAVEHPDNPNVAVAMLMHHGADSEDAGKWIEALIKNDPDNAAGNLFSARAAFASGDPFSALVELKAMGSSDRTDFFMDSAQETLVAAYKHAGYPDAAATVAGFAGVKVPASPMMDLNRELTDAMAAAHLDGDQGLVLSLGEAGMAAASRAVVGDGGEYLITRLIGYSMQRKVLGQLDEFELIPGDEELVFERLGKLDEELSSIKALVKESADLLPTITEGEVGRYFDIMKTEGEMAAMRWLIAVRKGEQE